MIMWRVMPKGAAIWDSIGVNESLLRCTAIFFSAFKELD